MKRVKTNFSAQIIILAVALLIALPVRVYQYLKVIDPTTGFFTSWTQPTVFGLYGLCLLTVILLIALSHKGGKKAVYAMPDKKNIALGITSIIFALTLVCDAGFQIMKVSSIFSGQSFTDKLVLGDSVGKSGVYFLIAQSIFAIISAIYLFVYGINYFSDDKNHKPFKYIAVAPVLWGITRLMVRFMQTISFRYVSELLFELLMVVFFCLFFISFIKFNEHMLESRVQTRVISYGLITVFFSLLSAVPRYIVVIMGRYDVFYRHDSLYQFCDIGVVLFVATVIFCAVAQMQYKNVEEYSGEAIQQSEEE